MVFNTTNEKSIGNEVIQSLNISDLIPGMYLVTLRSKNFYSQSEKILLDN